MDTQIAMQVAVTVETPQLILLDLIDPNPYQTRLEEDPAKIAEIAASIRENGLIHVPTARPINGRYQLALGHTRKAAYVLNGETHMPLFIRELDDQRMFNWGLDENIERAELTSIELAKAMELYMREFGKTSVECGVRFNCSPEKVRSTVRLLKLPEDLQAGVADGTITQNNARRLLTIQRAAPNKLKSVANKLNGRDVDPDKVIGEALTDSEKTVKMWERWQGGDPLAGHRLWKIYTPGDKFPNDLLPELKAGDLARALEIEKFDKYELQKWIDWLRMGFIHGPNAPQDKSMDETFQEYMIRTGVPADLVEKISHLVNPPGCSACPFYAKVDGNHYCTFKLCHSRKTRAYEQHVIDRAVKKLGIAVYSKKTDGDEVGLSSYKDRDKKLFESRHPDLRLKRGTNWAQHGFEGVPEGWMVVVTGETLKKMRAEKKQNSVNSQERQDNYYRDQRRMAKVREANERALFDFLWNVACPAFQPAVFNGSGCLAFYETFADRFCSGVPAEEPDEKAPKTKRIDFYQKSILFAIFDDDLWDYKIDEKNQAVRRLAKHLQGVAKTWGVTLPKDWMQKAKEADEGVTVETDKGDA